MTTGERTEPPAQGGEDPRNRRKCFMASDGPADRDRRGGPKNPMGALFFYAQKTPRCRDGARAGT